jgi:3-dehydroquinate synthase
MQTIHVTTKTCRYPIYIGAGLHRQFEILRPHIAGQQVLLVTNHTVSALYRENIAVRLKEAGKKYQEIILPDGEQYKNLSSLTLIFDVLLNNQYARNCTLLALGGGVIGDLTGFAAACYQRGVAFIQLPTTLLAQVDAAVGGKTAVNHYAGKNMLGAFHQPQCVVSDIDALKTLPEREYRAGFAEVIKHALTSDPTFWHWLLNNIEKLQRFDEPALQHTIAQCCLIKAKVVEQDEKEQGLRAILNFGHTVAHAIESGVGYGVYLHGEAVAIGLLVAARLSALLGNFPSAVVVQLEQWLSQCGLPTRAPQHFTKTQCWHHMRLDKKALNQQLRFVILNAVGDARVVPEVPRTMLDQALDQTGFTD